MKRAPFSLLLLFALVLLAFTLVRAQTPSPAQLRRAADRHFNEKSYALAVGEYQKWLASAPKTAPDRTAIAYRVAVALGKSQKWDAALSAWEKFLTAYRNEPLWKARGEYQLGLLLNAVPHQGYKVGAKTYRGTDYPKTDASEKPEQVWLSTEDAKASLTAFECAVKAYEQVKNAPAAEVADLYFDLAKLLPQVQYWGSKADWKAAKTTDWSLDVTKAYDAKWPMPREVLFFYARLPRLTPADTHRAALAGFARALFVARFRESWALHDVKDYRKITQSLPYYKLDPIALLTQTADAFPRDPQAAQMRLIAAQWTAQKGDFVDALARYRQLLAKSPSSKWAEDARAAVQEILTEGVQISTPGPQQVDKKAVVNVNSRNVKTLTLRAYKLALDDILLAKANIPVNQFGDFAQMFGDLKAAGKLGPKVAEWTVTTKDKADYKPVYETLTTPLAATGAYLVVAEGDAGRVRGGALVLISDLAVVKKTDKDSALCFVADARTGRPVPGAKVVVRQTYYDYSENNNNQRKVVVTRGQADADGVFLTPRLRRPNVNDVQMEAFAYAPGERYALTNQGYWNWYDGGDAANRDEIKVYAYTDRPVYRPKQMVYFRELLAKRVGGSDFKPLVGAKASVTVSNPKGETIFSQTLVSSEFGSVNGSFSLPSGAPLGEYSVSVSLPNVNSPVNDSGGNRFRVEEYKKPEFDVKITPSTTQARFGDAVTATIHAVTYAGAPVSNGKISYKVFRNPFYPGYRFPQPFDWLYRYDGNGDYAPDASNGELVTQGTATTDAAGNAKITFKADKGTRGYGGDYAYTIKADVVDASRRQISGEGVVKVTNQAFYAYLNVKNGFYQKGDKVQIEVRTQDANENAVAQKGTLTVKRITYDAKGGEVLTPVHTESVTTDADGKAFATWETDASGQFRVEWTGFDKFEKKVLGVASLWVTGDDMNERQFRVGGITLLTDKTTYEQGETAHLLVVADKPDDWVLLTEETGNQILTRKLIHVTGRSRTVDVPIVRAHIPNFALAAVAVRDYQFFQWQQEVFVPPARQFTTMTVTGDKAEYRPGDIGHFAVKTADAKGNPVAAEVSLAVVDSSLFYIQKDYAPDIRLFYYGDRRGLSVNAESSQQTAPPTRLESDIAVQKFKPHGIVLPDFGRLPGNSYVAYYGDGYNNYYGLGMPGAGGFGGGTRFRGLRDENGLMKSEYATKDDLGRVSNAPVSLAAAPMATVAGRTAMAAEKQARMQPQMAAARVRDYFPDTAFWTPAVVTSKADGTATVDVKFPDTLTTWKATARGLTAGVQVGAGDSEVKTNKRLLVRLEAPRFFVERDSVMLSAIVRNDLDTEKSVRVSLECKPSPPNPLSHAVGEEEQKDGAILTLSRSVGEGGANAPGEGNSGIQTVTIPAHAEKRVDWTANVVESGTANVKMTAETDEESDAVAQSFPVLTYGVQKFVASSGVMQTGQTAAKLTVNLPTERKAGSAALLVQLNPSLAATALDALPYLADYPYGCVEQTMSRFLPSVTVAKTLKDAGVDLDTLRKRALAMRERESTPSPFGQAKPTDGNTDQTGYTYPTGTPGVMKTVQLAEGLGHGDRWNNPVFDAARLKSMTDEGLSRLVSMQRSDGGWGWWPDSSASDAYMSAYVVYGLATVKSAGVPVPADVLSRGYAFLAKDIAARDDQRDLAVWEAFALSTRGVKLPAPASKIVAVLFSQREKLSAYGNALLALTLHNASDNEKAAVVCRNLQNTATIERENGTASWKTRYGWWWDWYNNDVETTAWALKAYVAVLPKSELAPMLVKWLVNHKRGNIWNSTKETAMTVYALTDYVKAENELAPDMKVTVALGEKVKRNFVINRENALLFDNAFLVPDTLLASGPQTVTVTKTGTGKLYYSSALQYFTTEEQIKGVGGELKVTRRYFKLTPKVGKQIDYNGGTFNTLDYTRTALTDGAKLTSGDLLEVELVTDAKNDYDYCIFEDMKPSGCEPLQLRSGGNYADNLYSNMELRDTKTAFFVDHLPQGRRVLRYRLRAEIPGAFHALPVNAYAMYAPDVRSISDGWHVTIGDAPVKIGSNLP